MQILVNFNSFESCPCLISVLQLVKVTYTVAANHNMQGQQMEHFTDTGTCHADEW